MKLHLTGIGTAVPDHSITQEEAAQLAGELGTSRKYARTLGVLYRRSGVNRRYSVLLDSSSNSASTRQSFYSPADTAPHGPTTAERMRRYQPEATKLAKDACHRALADAQLCPEAITHLVTVSCSGFAAPGVDLALIRELPLSPEVARVHVGFMGCHGTLNGLRVADGLLAAHPDARILVCAVELCSLHHQFTDDPQQLVANTLFSDGAAAIVVQPMPGDSGSDSLVLIDQASVILPDSVDLMSWHIGDHGFEMSLSPTVPELLCRHLTPWVDQWLNRCGWTRADVDHWIVHPGGPRILSAAATALGLTDEQIGPSREILESHGNMSSPTVLFILEHLWRSRTKLAGERMPAQLIAASVDRDRPSLIADGRSGVVRSGDRYVMLAFGPGLTIEAAAWMSD